MKTDFPIARLSDVAEVRSGFAFKSSDMGESGVPLIKIKNITPPTVDVRDVERVPDEAIRGIPRAERYRLEHRDILVAMTGATVGKVGRFPRTEEAFYLNQRVGKVYLKDANAADYDFLYYVLAQPHYVEQMFGLADGSAQANISGSQIERLEIPLAPLPEQRAIAHILGTLDDKIELNRRMSETLEAIARALFKSWFVDFEPVLAKAAGRDPGLPQPLADLFPDRLVDSELGEIPEGWGFRTVEDVCSTVTRGVTPKYENGSGRFIINQAVNRGVQLDWTELKELSCALDVSADRYAKRWDVLVNCLGEGTLGRVHLFKGKSDIYAIDQHMSVCRGITPGVGAYLYQVLASSNGQEKIESLKTGSTGMTMLNISKLRRFDVLWPGDVLIKEFFWVVEPALTRVADNEEQSRTLAALRDTLMPKLISGELRIKDAEKFLGRADI